MADKALSLYY